MKRHLLFFMLCCSTILFAQNNPESYQAAGAKSGKTRIAGMYGTFDAGTTVQGDANSFQPQSAVRPFLSASLGKQILPKIGVGTGAGLYDFIIVTAPVFAEINYTPTLVGVTPFLRGRVGYSFPLDNFGQETSLVFPFQGPDSRSYDRGGLFARTEFGVRFVTPGGVDLMPTFGYTFANYTEGIESPDFREETKINFRRLTLGMGVKF